METDFDKEIDALLRNDATGRTITISEFRDGLHLDADEIAAFAEKRVPPAVRKTIVTHFAGCDRCRRILGNTAQLNAEEKQAAAAGVAAPVGSALPWYRRLFLFPQLAYVMGGLIVLFAGIIGLSVLTRSYLTGESDISRTANVSGRRPESAPATAPATSSNSSMNTAANAANTGANAPVIGETAVPVDDTAGGGAGSKQGPSSPADEGFAKDAQPQAAAPAPPATEPIPMRNRRAQELQVKPEAERDRSADEPKAMSVAQPPSVTPAPKESVRSDDRELSDIQTSRPKMTRKEDQTGAPKKEALSAPSGAGVSATTVRKYVGGRTFELKQGVWYDTAFRGQATVNVRRDTKEFRALDSGLRSIAESFTGSVVVTVWEGRAYRIQ